MIEYIEIEKILPHPNNPRKDLGDLEELTESIRENGVLQNLTLVPAGDGRYYCVIGHRRTEASKLAGLEKVPCVIKDMDEKTQIQTMLMENIQRNDLTPFEQAQGFQMMMDLGSSITDIVKETGFSESTVRHRLKLNELDQEVLQEKSEERNISMTELMELEKIEDPELKNKALKSIGTKDFVYTVKSIADTEKRLKKTSIMKERLELFAAEIPSDEENVWQRYAQVAYWPTHSMKEEEIAQIDLSEYENIEGLYFQVEEYNAFLYKKKEETQWEAETEDDQGEIARKEDLKQRRQKMNSIYHTMAETRFEFAKYISVKAVKASLSRLIREAGLAIVMEQWWWEGSEYLERLIDFSAPKNPDEDYDEDEVWEQAIRDRLKQYPEVTLFQIVCSAMEVECNAN